jgi:hypothetical protein
MGVNNFRVYRSRTGGELPNDPSELRSLISRAQTALQELNQATDAFSPVSVNYEIVNSLATLSTSEPPAPRRFSFCSSQTHCSPQTLSSDFAEAQDDYPCFVGLNLHGLARMSGRNCAPELMPLLHHDGEAFLERETAQYSPLFGGNKAKTLDLTSRTCWKNQQSFARNILTWYPIFDQESSTKLVREATESNFEPSKSSTCLSFFILALGTFTRAEDTLVPTPIEDTPGLEYFQAGSRCLNSMTSETCTITEAQCFILKA